MKKKHIVILIDWYLPGTNAGGPVRSVHSLVTLLRDTFHFTVITTNKDLGSTLEYTTVTSDTLLEDGNVRYYYYSHRELSAKNLTRLISSLQPDAVYLNSFWSFRFSILIVLLKAMGMFPYRVILAPRGMLGSGALSIKPAKKRFFLFFARILRLYRGIQFHATKPEEINEIGKFFPNTTTMLAPNVNSSAPAHNTSLKHSGALKLFFLSRISRVKNLDIALSILKECNSCRIEFDIYGAIEDESYWNECKKTMSALPSNITVNYKGILRFDEVQDTICNYHALLLPTRNENFGHAIVESMLCGCIPIISDQTPWNDLEGFNCGYVVALAEKKGFVAAIGKLCELGQEEFNSMSASAIRYMTARTDHETIKQQYLQLFND